MSDHLEKLRGQLTPLVNVCDQITQEHGARCLLFVVEEADVDMLNNRLEELRQEIELRQEVREGSMSAPDFATFVVSKATRFIGAWDSALNQVGMAFTGMIYPARQKAVAEERSKALLRELASRGGADVEEMPIGGPGQSVLASIMRKRQEFSERAALLEKLRQMRMNRTGEFGAIGAGAATEARVPNPMAALMALVVLAAAMEEAEKTGRGAGGAVPVPTLDTVRAAMRRGYQPTPEIAQAVNALPAPVVNANGAAQAFDYRAGCNCDRCQEIRKFQAADLFNTTPDRLENGQ
jgi:hypothetical protein